MKRVVITGAGGQIGHGLIPRLSETFEVLATDIKPLDFENSETERLDVLDSEELRNKFKDADSVVHLAGESKVDAGWVQVLEKNIIATKQVLKAAVDEGIDTVVLASSNHVVGQWEKDVGEALYSRDSDISVHPHEDEVRPDSYYGVSKITVEALGKYFAETTDLSVVCIRIGNVIEEDKIPDTDRDAAMWLSNDDMAQLVRKSINSDVKFDIFFGVSGNERRFYSLENANKRIGYAPSHDGSCRRSELYDNI